MRVLIAVDSFKGTISSPDVADAIAAGWRSVRPDDEIDLLPLADGGEGTADVVATAVPGSVRHVVPDVTGPDGRPVEGVWVELPGGIAVVDLAQMSGLPLMRHLDPRRATTRGLGETIRAAIDAGMHEVWIGLGGSASTDGGLGALRALGLRADADVRAEADELPDGGAALADLRAVHDDELVPIPGGVTLLTDVTSPLLGPDGAASVFGPQKGATAQDITMLDAALANLTRVLGADPAVPGSGAAGGTAYGFAALYGARIVSGIDHVAALTDLDGRIGRADLVITGEGAFDHQSLRGKLVGVVLERARAAGRPSAVVAGAVVDDPGVPSVALTDLAGSPAAAMRSPAEWAARAGAVVAERLA